MTARVWDPRIETSRGSSARNSFALSPSDACLSLGLSGLHLEAPQIRIKGECAGPGQAEPLNGSWELSPVPGEWPRGRGGFVIPVAHLAAHLPLSRRAGDRWPCSESGVRCHVACHVVAVELWTPSFPVAAETPWSPRLGPEVLIREDVSCKL